MKELSSEERKRWENQDPEAGLPDKHLLCGFGGQMCVNACWPPRGLHPSAGALMDECGLIPTLPGKRPHRVEAGWECECQSVKVYR